MKSIGYWRESESSSEPLPWPEEGRLSEDTKKLVANYLKKGREHTAWKGWSNCRVCNKMNGSVCMTDGEFIYPVGYAHYILDHNIAPDLDLLSKILSDYKLS